MFFWQKKNSRKIIICSFGIIGWLDPVNCKIDNCYEKQKFQLDFWPHSSLSLIEFFWWSRGGGMTWAISQKVLKFEIFRSRQMMKINLAWSKPSSGSIVWPQLLSWINLNWCLKLAYFGAYRTQMLTLCAWEVWEVNCDWN